ncbi:hypothetical protein ANN_20181 [Periplaneta americana]|uniref:Uncharacterized protein n=1 Tax=Periplaneta americana TaxID=6978 RepID=A0ABQ8SCA8_PERAM|nr:hypothetical protein ANN_20181 [Periplaneta americana]
MHTVTVQEVRAHLYSMWTGSDLTFMKLPESSEPPDSTQVAEPNTGPGTSTTASTSSSTNSGEGPQRFSQMDPAHTFYSGSK